MADQSEVDRLYNLLSEEQRESVGGGMFREIGQAFVHHFKSDCGLQPHHAFLDAGCGIGRVAIPITTYLSAAGHYEGFDVVASSISWCQEHITSKHPNFHFQHADIFNTFYNPQGRIKSSEYVFPYSDNYFDVVFAGSLFTHLMPDAIKHYLCEIARVLKPGGRFLGTFFLLTPESLAALHAGKSTLRFVHKLPGCRVLDPKRPEAAVACERPMILDFCKNCGLTVKNEWLGVWSGRTLTGYGGYQDMIMAERPASV